MTDRLLLLSPLQAALPTPLPSIKPGTLPGRPLPPLVSNRLLRLELLQITFLSSEGLSKWWNSEPAVDLCWIGLNILKTCGTWAYISSSWLVTNLLRSFKLPLITCKVPGTVGPLQVFVLMFCTSQWFFPRGWFSQGSSTSITGQDFAMEAGGDKLLSERWSLFGPKAIQKSTNDPGMSSKISCPARAWENCHTTNSLAISGALFCLCCYLDHLVNVCYSYHFCV